MSQFTLKADPASIHFQTIKNLVEQFEALPNASSYLNISGLKGSVLYVTDNIDSPIVSPGNREKLSKSPYLGAYRALDQDKFVSKAIILNPDPPDSKPLLNVLIHEIGHEKWPGLGMEDRHDPCFMRCSTILSRPSTSL